MLAQGCCVSSEAIKLGEFAVAPPRPRDFNQPTEFVVRLFVEPDRYQVKVDWAHPMGSESLNPSGEEVDALMLTSGKMHIDPTRREVGGFMGCGGYDFGSKVFSFPKVVGIEGLSSVRVRVGESTRKLPVPPN
jgi:hypothetical protein